MSGFDVNAEDLRGYAGKLDAQRGTATQIHGLVDTADVTDKSWGLYGLFVKDEYTKLLTDLKDMFTNMEKGFQSGSDKFKAAADGYEEHERAVEQLLAGLGADVEGTKKPSQ